MHAPRSGRRRTAVALLGLLIGTAAHADQVTLAPVKDNTLYSDGNDLSNGAGSQLFAGMNNNGAIRRGLLAFDIAAGIPAGSTITGVQLTLQLTKTLPTSKPVSLHRVAADWGEGSSNAAGEEGGGTNATADSATWRYRFFSHEAWATRGGDFTAAASAMQQVGGLGPYTWGSTPQLVADVQGWLDAPSTNFGWLLHGDESSMTTAKRFGSRENSSLANRPRLIVDFAPLGGGATATPTATEPAETPNATAAPTITATEATSATATEVSTATPTPPAGATTTATALDSATPTATTGDSPTATPLPTTTPTDIVAAATATATPAPCVGDCDGSGTVGINELIIGVNIALGGSPVSTCPAFDNDGSATVGIGELIGAVNNALNGGCP